jgi:hypothetical protein
MAEDNKKEINLDELEEVSGGYLYKPKTNGGYISIQVINENGDVVKTFGLDESTEAEKWAKENNISTKYISDQALMYLRNKKYFN